MHQPNLFSHSLVEGPSLAAEARHQPWAHALRPATLAQVLGQQALLGPQGALAHMAQQGALRSLVLWGPPGVGKTTLAQLLAQASGHAWVQLSAVNSGLKELREAVAEAKQRYTFYQQRTVLFIDELHRYSRSQQDALLPHVEVGEVVLLGATTENPYFYLNKALLSRLLLFQLEPLGEAELMALVKKALQWAEHTFNTPCQVQAKALSQLLRYANGDARSLLTLLEAAYWASPRTRVAEGDERLLCTINAATVEALAQRQTHETGNAGDTHYNLASAFQKSLRGSDADAAIYYLARLLASGEDPRFVARRLLVCAAEDVGLADPQAFVLANHAFQATEQLGMPEARIPLALATAYVARAPKCNAAYEAINQALEDVTQHGKTHPVPLHLRDTHYAGAKAMGHGEGYVYTHANPQASQSFLPKELEGVRYLRPPSL